VVTVAMPQHQQHQRDPGATAAKSTELLADC